MSGDTNLASSGIFLDRDVNNHPVPHGPVATPGMFPGSAGLPNPSLPPRGPTALFRPVHGPADGSHRQANGTGQEGPETGRATVRRDRRLHRASQGGAARPARDAV